MKARRKEPRNEYAAFERALKQADERAYVLRLYVTGGTKTSRGLTPGWMTI